jgi:Bacterial Ig domain
MKNNFKKFTLGLAGFVATGTLFAGCGSSENFVFTNTVAQPIAQPPIAQADTFQALGNATLNQAAPGVLTNDTVNGATVSSFDATGSNGGTVNLDANGSFTYTPVVGFTGTETFAYTLTNADGESTATVTLNVPNQGFFVNNQAAPGGDGSQAAPFDNLADARTAAASGDIIYVFRGDGTPFAGGFTLADGVSLIGEGNGLVVAQQIEPSGTAPEIGGITLAGNNTVSGFLFTGNTDAITASVVSNLTITNNTFQTADSNQVDLEDIGGTLVVSGNTFELQDNDEGLYLDQDNTNATVEVMNNTVRLLASGDGDGGDGLYLDIFGTSVVTATVSGNTVTGSGDSNSGMNLNNGIYIENYGTSSLTQTLDNNTVTGVANEGFYLGTYDSGTLTSNGTGNSATDQPDDYALYYYASDTAVATFNLSALTVQNIGNDGLYFEVDDDANLTASVTGSTFSNTTSDGLYAEIDANSANEAPRFTLFLTNNNFSGHNNNAVEFDADSSDVNADLRACLDISGNTFNGDNLRITSDASNGTSVVDVEQLNTLDDPAVNNFTNGAMLDVPVGTGTINNRPDGFCTIP